jgi:hypothetical protein
MAEIMEEIRLPRGGVIDDTTFRKDDDGLAFVIVEEGVLAQHRVVAFEGERPGTASTMPHGTKDVKIRDYGPRTMFPLPGAGETVSFQFQMVATQPVLAHLLRLDDPASMLLKTQTEKLVQMMRQQPDDEQIKGLWLERQETVLWHTFRKEVMKRARRLVKAEKAIAGGDFGIRKPARPKSIKDHRPYAPIVQKLYE